MWLWIYGGRDDEDGIKTKRDEVKDQCEHVIALCMEVFVHYLPELPIRSFAPSLVTEWVVSKNQRSW
jgi:hypothetical protein